MTASPVRQGTTYLVLKEEENSGTDVKRYKQLERDVEASSANEAIKKAATAAGTYVAVPSRSFKPVTVTVETTTTVKLT